MKKNIGHITSAANKWFGHLRSEDGLIDGNDVMIYHNCCENNHFITDVSVVYFPREYLLSHDDHPLWAVEDQKNRSFTYSFGNCNSEWMQCASSTQTPVYCKDAEFNDPSTPKQVFEYFCANGFKSREHLDKAINEFSCIRECEWARNPDFDPSPLYIPAEIIRAEREQKNKDFYHNNKLFKSAVKYEIYSGSIIEPKIVKRGLDREVYLACKQNSPETIEYQEYEKKIEALRKYIFAGNLTKPQEAKLFSYGNELEEKEKLFNQALKQGLIDGTIEAPDYIKDSELNNRPRRCSGSEGERKETAQYFQAKRDLKDSIFMHSDQKSNVSILKSLEEKR